MSKGIYDTYGSRAFGPSAYYPEGIFKDETSPGMENGTPLQRDWATNIEAIMQRIRLEGHIVPSEVLDDAVTNQTWNGLLRRLGNAPPQATPLQLCAGFPETDWSDPAASPNYLDTGDQIRDACVGYNWKYSTHFLWVLHDDNSIHAVSAYGYYSTPALADFTFTWGTTPDEIVSIVADDYYLYVAWYTTGSQVYISKFAQTDFTGTLIYTWGTGITARSTNGVRMCIGDTNRLCYAIDNASNGIYMGSLVRSGTTNTASYFSSYKSLLTSWKIISDGTYMYVIGVDDSASPTYTFALLRAQITSPSTQNTYNIVIVNINTQYEFAPISIQRVKDLIIMSNIDGYVYALISGSVHSLFEPLPHDWYDSTGPYGISMGTDGRNIYSLMCEYDEYGSYGLYSVFKMPIHQFHGSARSASPVALDHTRARIATANPAGLSASSLLYDGVDMWLILYTGEIYRICDTK